MNNNLKAFFDKQMNTLSRRGYPEIVENLERMRDEVIAITIKLKVSNNHIPFLPVIPKSMVNLNSQLRMVFHGGRAGYLDLNQSMLHNIVGIPNTPYFIYDIEYGKIAEDMVIEEQDRFYITVEEAIALCIHTPDVLGEQSVACFDSQYENNNLVPVICIRHDKPCLYWDVIAERNEKRGYASCHRFF